MLPRPWKFAVLSRLIGGDRAARSLGVTVGSGCRIYSCKVASEYFMVSIGDRTTVSVEVLFITHDGTGWLVQDERGRRYKYGRISIGSGCFIGARATVMPGVQIGDGSIVAAGALVTESVPPGVIVAGVPARIVGETSELLDRVKDWPAEADMTGADYEARVRSIANAGFAPTMQRSTR